MTAAKQGWADLSVKPSKSKSKTASKPRAKGAWDVDDSKADHIYGQFTRFDRPAYMDFGSWQNERDEKVDQAMVKRLKASVSMVQNFVDALSGEQSNYTVSLDPDATTAYTDLHNRIMKLPSTTILDPTLTDQEAALLMVAFLGHEIGHVRIDDSIDKAMRQDFNIIERGLYNSLSTILREARVEAGFSDAFPGYSGLFEPMLRWISRETKDGSTPPKDALGFAVAATRYPFRFDWSDPDHAAEAAWWVGWVERNARIEDYPGHKAALDEAYAHIKAALKQQQDEREQGGNPGQSKTGKSPYESASSTAGQMDDYDLKVEKNAIKRKASQDAYNLHVKARDGEMTYEEMYEQRDQIMKQAKKDQAALTRSKNEADKASASIPSSIEQVEVMRKEIENQRKGRAARERARDPRISPATSVANRELGYDGSGRPLQPARLGPKQTRAMGKVEADPDAVGIFRSTFIRLRGGNDGRIGGKRSGRLDDRRIFRLADKNDDRVFTRRGAPKTQHLRVYLMVDTSGSMAGEREKQIRGVAKALIEASFGADKLTLEVYGWDNQVAPVWVAGDDPNDVLRMKARGGTSDADSLLWAIERMKANLRQEEHGLIIMMSDGQGQGDLMLKTMTDKARAAGMSVFGITMAEDLDQSKAYGAKGFVKWQGSVAKTAQPLAEIISQAWLTKDQQNEGARS